MDVQIASHQRCCRVISPVAVDGGVLFGLGPGGDEYLGQHNRPSDNDYFCVDDFDEYHYAADHYAADDHYDDQCGADDNTA